MSRIVWSADAKRDLRDITLYYGQFAPDLPLRLIDRIDLAALRLVDHPRLGAELPDSDVRTWLARGTPYVLLYRLTRDGVRILQVRHGRSDWRPAS